MRQAHRIRLFDKCFRHAEIDHLYDGLSFFGFAGTRIVRIRRGGDQHQIRRLQIPVHEALLFRCGQCAADLQGDVDGRERVERPGPANTRLQRFAFHQFHRAEALPVLFADTEMVNGRDIWMPQRCGRPCFAHEPFACFRSAFHPFRIDELERNRPFERGVNRAIRHSHGAAAEFPQRSIVASLDPVIPESIRYGRKRCFVRFFRVVESDAQQANHAAPKTAGKSSLQPRPALRTDRRASRLCLH